MNKLDDAIGVLTRTEHGQRVYGLELKSIRIVLTVLAKYRRVAEAARESRKATGDPNMTATKLALLLDELDAALAALEVEG